MRARLRSTVARLETALEGKGLEENGINLKALSALWGDDLSESVVYHGHGISGWEGERSQRGRYSQGSEWRFLT